MQGARRKLLFGLTALTVLVISAAAIFGRHRIAEEWYVYRLHSTDSVAIDAAALKLGELKSLRAIDALVALIPAELEKGRRMQAVFRQPNAYETDSPVFKALHAIGEPAHRAVEEAAHTSSAAEWVEDIAPLRRAMKLPATVRYAQILPPPEPLLRGWDY